MQKSKGLIGFETFLSTSNSLNSAGRTASIDKDTIARDLLECLKAGPLSLPELEATLQIPALDVSSAIDMLEEQQLVDRTTESDKVQLTEFANEALGVFRMR
jgi:hypothetical protein